MMVFVIYWQEKVSKTNSCSSDSKPRSWYACYLNWKFLKMVLDLPHLSQHRLDGKGFCLVKFC